MNDVREVMEEENGTAMLFKHSLDSLNERRKNIERMIKFTEDRLQEACVHPEKDRSFNITLIRGYKDLDIVTETEVRTICKVCKKELDFKTHHGLYNPFL